VPGGRRGWYDSFEPPQVPQQLSDDDALPYSVIRHRPQPLSDETPGDEQVLGTPPPYQIPADERRWFTQVLSSTTAAAMLAFAGNNASAAGYATARQLGWQQEPLDDFGSWANTTSDRIRLQGGPTLLGHTQRMWLGDGRTLAVFRGLESNLYR
jgi:hypothetical protein